MYLCYFNYIYVIFELFKPADVYLSEQASLIDGRACLLSLPYIVHFITSIKACHRQWNNKIINNNKTNQTKIRNTCFEYFFYTLLHLMQAKKYSSSLTRSGFICRKTTPRVQRLQEGFQTQTPPDRTLEAALRWETLPVRQVREAFLSLRLVLPAHESPLLLLQEGRAKFGLRLGATQGSVRARQSKRQAAVRQPDHDPALPNGLRREGEWGRGRRGHLHGRHTGGAGGRRRVRDLRG